MPIDESDDLNGLIASPSSIFEYIDTDAALAFLDWVRETVLKIVDR